MRDRHRTISDRCAEGSSPRSVHSSRLRLHGFALSETAEASAACTCSTSFMIPVISTGAPVRKHAMRIPFGPGTTPKASSTVSDVSVGSTYASLIFHFKTAYSCTRYDAPSGLAPVPAGSHPLWAANPILDPSADAANGAYMKLQIDGKSPAKLT